MKQWSNFYFWASWILMGFLFFLIFGMYNQKFYIFRFLDYTTMFLVLGTLGGAFLGAFFAGKYSANLVGLQLKHQAALIEKQKLDTSMKHATIALATLGAISNRLTESQGRLNNVKYQSQMSFEINSFHKFLKKYLRQIQTLNLINTSRYEMFMPLQNCIMVIEHLIEIFDMTQVKESSKDELDSELLEKIQENFHIVSLQLNEELSTLHKEFNKDVLSLTEVNSILKEI